MIVDSNVIIANSNNSSGPSSSSSSASTGGDHKMVPAAIGSERKRHMSIPTTVSSTPISGTSDWSAVSKRMVLFIYFPLGTFFSFRNTPNGSISTAAVAASFTII